MFNIKRIIYILITVLIAANISACNENSDSGNYVESGELVVIEDSTEIKLSIYDIDTLNPLETKSESVKKIMNIVYEPLFAKEADMTSSPVLASGYTVSEDGRQITVNLKDGVKWQDGTVFTANDVVHTLSKMRSSGGFYKKTADKIRSFTAVSKNQVVINFETPQPCPELLLTFPIVAKSTAYVPDTGFVPMGTGSYKFSSKNSMEIVLEPNSIWHGGEPSKKTVLVKILKDKNAAAEAFNVNEIDAITSDELSLEASTPKNSSRPYAIVSDNMVFLGFNTTSPVLMPANVRKAVESLLDKKKILENDVYGHGMVSDSAVNPSSWAYQPKSDTAEDYAESLIVSEGYILSEGIYYKNGLPLAIRILVNSDNAARTALADSIADTLKTAGFSVIVEKVGYNDYITKIMADDFDMFIGEVEVEPNLNPASMLSGDNYFNFNASTLAQEMTKLIGITDKEAYKKGVSDFVRSFYADPPYIPLYFRTESVIYGSYVWGTEKPSGEDPFKNIEKWYFYDKDGTQESGDIDE